MDKDTVPTWVADATKLAEWAAAIEQEIVEITSSITPLQLRLNAAKEKLDLVHRLIHLSAAPSNLALESQDHSRSAGRQTLTPEIEDRIEEVMQTASKPLHITEIRSSLVQKGVPLPGRGDEANLILRIRRATDRFVRTGRGTYGLAAWNIPEYSPPRKKRKVRRIKAVPQ